MPNSKTLERLSHKERRILAALFDADQPLTSQALADKMEISYRALYKCPGLNELHEQGLVENLRRTTGRPGGNVLTASGRFVAKMLATRALRSLKLALAGR
jgi:predicted transcriptional regulator